MKPSQTWGQERRLLTHWAMWCLRSNSGIVMRLCGLTWAGSPKAVMSEIFERGAVSEDDVTGYARDMRPPSDEDALAINDFMDILRIVLPPSYTALVGRHRRMLHGESVLIRSERWIARAIYGLETSASWRRLDADCSSGYAALHRWIVARSEAQKKVA